MEQLLDPPENLSRESGGPPTKLSRRVALITGGASGIARAVAILFAREGASVVVADADVPGGSETVEKIRAAGGRASFAELDVSQAAQVSQVVEKTLDQFGGLHVLFNGAGVLAYGTVLETAEEEWARVLSINLTGTYLCCRAALPSMVKQGRGSIVNVASTTGAHDACARAAAYVSSKGGVTLLTRAMAIDHAKQGIRVNAICPGPTDTPMLRKALTAEQLDSFAKTFPMGRLGRPEEIANAALFLASDDASFVTGSTLYVDGGQTAEV
ncbi:MAG: SDR family NAD(P)-dependent oxidoreductase [Acidobacteriaceae bacterium]